MLRRRLNSEVLMPRYSQDKDIDLEVRLLVKRGWFFKSGRRHGKLMLPRGSWVTVPTTPSDRRALCNFRRDVKRGLRG